MKKSSNRAVGEDGCLVYGHGHQEVRKKQISSAARTCAARNTDPNLTATDTKGFALDLAQLQYAQG
jgi:hypothetical protein